MSLDSSIPVASSYGWCFRSVAHIEAFESESGMAGTLEVFDPTSEGARRLLRRNQEVVGIGDVVCVPWLRKAIGLCGGLISTVHRAELIVRCSRSAS